MSEETIKEPGKKLNVVVTTNSIIHYTVHFCEAFLADERVEHVYLIICEDLGKEYRTLGLSETAGNNNLQIIDSRKEPQRVKEIIDDCDILIGQYYLADFFQDRINAGKMVFILSERIFKQYDTPPVNLYKNTARWFKYKQMIAKNHYQRDNVFFLTIGRYAAEDYLRLGIRRTQILRCAYFPALSKVKERQYYQNGIIRLLWIGRFVSWKKPEYAIETYRFLAKKGYSVELTMVGNGTEEDNLKQLAGGDPHIRFTGGLPEDKVRREMQNSDIYLFTSTQGEGWGLVLSEAMSEGMVPIASASAGATTELVEDGKNGYIYYQDHAAELKEKTELLAAHPEKLAEMGNNARRTIEEQWNAENATSRLIDQYLYIQEHNAAKALEGVAGFPSSGK
jgi:glycosyltransferase involved in cell wall biosynthesis